MKKSQGITLTVVAAVAMATAHGQAPAPPVSGTPAPSGMTDLNSCTDVVNHTADVRVPANCLRASHNGFVAATRVGGFGATAQRLHAVS